MVHDHGLKLPTMCIPDAVWQDGIEWEEASRTVGKPRKPAKVAYRPGRKARQRHASKERAYPESHVKAYAGRQQAGAGARSIPTCGCIAQPLGQPGEHPIHHGCKYL